MIKLQVSDMRCMSCVHNIQDEIRDADPSVTISADLKNGQIEVKSDLDAESLIKLVENAGYTATVVTK